ncbi:hypothetical protein T01_10969 [Trichinella spiralis]|uniref:Uncharacterized protein n=1 Tax=Trichinella spiralis TaxID=6334 RepID=A0A0V1BZP7_TRISP|nr:hypothetical protein T01_10969 [Trichinella spiralis]
MKAIAVLLRIRRCRIKSLFSARFRSIHKYATDTSQPICPVNKETQNAYTLISVQIDTILQGKIFFNVQPQANGEKFIALKVDFQR